jgi:hypothetical protein
VAGDAEFAHNKNLKRNTEPPRDLKSDWDPASRKAENDDVIASGITHQLLRELPTGIGAVLKNFGWRHGRSTI